MAQTATQEAQRRIGSRNKDVPWYTDSIGSRLGPSASKLLEEYSHIPSDQVESHIYNILLHRLTHSHQTFLDLGCCFGQDLRALAAAGAPSQNLYATDLRQDFWELGYELFKDKETLQSRFIEADVLADDNDAATGQGLKELDEKIDVIYAGSFLHLFDYEGQSKVCERIVRLLKPVEGSVVAGRQVGCVVAGERLHRTNYRESMFRHNEESFKTMWEKVGEKTGSKWRVEAELKEVQGREHKEQWDPQVRQLVFTVIRE